MSQPDPVDHHLDRLAAVAAAAQTAPNIGPEGLAHAFAAVGAINQQITSAPTRDTTTIDQPLTAAPNAMLFGPSAPDDLVQKLQQWIDRLLTELKKLVQLLADVVTFSLSVGTTISLTIEFDGKSTTA